MMEDKFEPPFAGLFLLVNFWFVKNVVSLNLGPLVAESAFEKMLPSYFVLGVDKSSEDEFLVFWIHLRLWIVSQFLTVNFLASFYFDI